MASTLFPLLYAAACFGAICFQVALIAGAPWGPVTQGGTNPGALPLSGRIIAVVSIILLLGMAGGVASAAGAWPHWPRWTGWAALVVQAVSTFLNWITPSRAERRLWGPITSVMLALAALSVLP